MIRQEDATYFSDLIKKRELSPLELVKKTIEKIEKLNPKVNAVVNERYEKALKTATEKDFSTKLFGGVPILLKDLGQDIENEKNTAGSKLLKEYYSSKTSYYTKKLEDLGFIILGQTASPEFGFTNFTNSSLHGVTRNPINPEYHAGGSSGGAAAAVASGMVPLAGAGDGGGSIRIPASWTNLVGLKPSRGRIPTGPDTYRGWQGASVNFALTKSLRDTKKLFFGMQEEQWESPFTLPLLKKTDNNLEKIRIAYSKQSPVGTPVSPEAISALLETVERLSHLGFEVVEDQPDLDGIALMESYYLMNGAETAAMVANLEKRMGRQICIEDMETRSWIIYQAGKNIKASAYSKALNLWDYANQVMCQFHRQYPLYLTPSTAYAAPKIKDYGRLDDFQHLAQEMGSLSQPEKERAVWNMFIEGLTLTPFTQQANLTGQPAISLPLYKTREGLPVGLQFTAAKGREDLLFLIAEVLEPYFMD